MASEPKLDSEIALSLAIGELQGACDTKRRGTVIVYAEEPCMLWFCCNQKGRNRGKTPRLNSGQDLATFALLSCAGFLARLVSSESEKGFRAVVGQPIRHVRGQKASRMCRPTNQHRPLAATHTQIRNGDTHTPLGLLGTASVSYTHLTLPTILLV